MLAGLAAEVGEGERAAHLLGHAERMLDDAAAAAAPFQLREIEHTRAAAEELLGHERFVAAIEIGRDGDLAGDLSSSA